MIVSLYRRAVTSRRAANQPRIPSGSRRAYFTQVTAQLTRRQFLDYVESVLRFEQEAKHLLAGGRAWQGEAVLLGTRGDKDAFKYLDTLSKLYPNSGSYVFEEKGGHHMSFVFPEVYTRVLSQYLE